MEMLLGLSNDIRGKYFFLILGITMECNPWCTFSLHVVESQKGMKK
jgi:hypothetical protein